MKMDEEASDMVASCMETANGCKPCGTHDAPFVCVSGTESWDGTFSSAQATAIGLVFVTDMNKRTNFEPRLVNDMRGLGLCMGFAVGLRCGARTS